MYWFETWLCGTSYDHLYQPRMYVVKELTRLINMYCYTLLFSFHSMLCCCAARDVITSYHGTRPRVNPSEKPFRINHLRDVCYQIKRKGENAVFHTRVALSTLCSSFTIPTI